MPEPTHPPYESGALTTPRQLQRWLDINAQNGALTRTRFYISVPSFNINHVWNGYSEIVGEYHYEAPNNFSLLLSDSSNLLSLNTNYTLCVSYVNSDNTVVRYSLIRAANDLFYSELVPYNGQLIKKNFRIEVWNAGSGGVSSDIYTSLVYTSVLGHNDYRYATDGPLIGADNLCEGQQSVGIIPTTPPDLHLLVWLDPATNASAAQWTDRKFNTQFTVNNESFTFFAPNKGTIGTAQAFSSDEVETPRDFYFHFYYISPLTNAEILFTVGGVAAFRVYLNSNNPGSDPKSMVVLVNDTYSAETDSVLYSGVEYIIHVVTDAITGTLVEIYSANDLLLIASASIPQGITFDGAETLEIGNSFNTDTNISTRVILVYDEVLSDELKQPVLDYIGSTIADSEAMTLPLTWGTCAAPTLNT